MGNVFLTVAEADQRNIFRNRNSHGIQDFLHREISFFIHGNDNVRKIRTVRKERFKHCVFQPPFRQKSAENLFFRQGKAGFCQVFLNQLKAPETAIHAVRFSASQHKIPVTVVRYQMTDHLPDGFFLIYTDIERIFHRGKERI